MFLPYAHQSIQEEDIAAVTRALKSEMITRGPEVEAFEKEIAAYCGAQHAVAFNSASSALIACCHAAELGPNDLLISSPNTFIASISGAFHFRATPVFVDIDRETGNARVDQMLQTANQPTSRGKPVLIPVHFAGLPVDVKTLEDNLRSLDAVIIEDAAQALGSRYYPDGPRIGSCAFSQMTVFSFHPAKVITTGEGGMVTTNDETLAHRLRRFRNNGIERDPTHLTGEAKSWYYEVQEISNNLNFTDLQAALGRSQLARLDTFIAHRRTLVKAYREQLKDLPTIKLLTDRHDADTAFHLFVVQIDFPAHKTSREQVMQQLKAAGIGTQVHYIPLYLHPYCEGQCGDLSDYFPETESYYAQALSLPLYSDLTLADIERVVRELKKALGL
ncbi:MAG: DegT/DnrJ/EryC1/StrS family aminotransferase [Parachlamydia sp.]|nr:DegT/DnrJ/EryC1/StrS family aminotransferase [Parachlamydia sp.]